MIPVVEVVLVRRDPVVDEFPGSGDAVLQPVVFDGREDARAHGDRFPQCLFRRLAEDGDGRIVVRKLLKNISTTPENKMNFRGMGMERKKW